MRCKACHYSLKELTEPRCPECGRAFDPNDPDSFDDDTRLRLPPKSTMALIAIISLMPTAIGSCEVFSAYGMPSHPGDIIFMGTMVLCLWILAMLTLATLWYFVKDLARER